MRLFLERHSGISLNSVSLGESDPFRFSVVVISEMRVSLVVFGCCSIRLSLNVSSERRDLRFGSFKSLRVGSV